MIKRIISVLLICIMGTGLMTGCSLFESNEKYLAKFEQTGQKIEEGAPIFNNIFVKDYKNLFNEMEIYLMEEDASENKEPTALSWDQIKGQKLSVAEGLAAMGSAQYEGITIFATVDEGTDMSMTWGQAMSSKIVNLVSVFNSDTPAAQKFFGELVKTKPIDAIKESCGNPTMYGSSDEEEKLNIMLFYQMEDSNVMVVAIKNEDGKTWDVSMIYTKSE